jgi:hypothetical protein
MHFTHTSQKLKSMFVNFYGPPVHPNFNERGGGGGGVREKWFSLGHLSPLGVTGPPPPPLIPLTP